MNASEAVRPSDWVFAGTCLAAAAVIGLLQWTGAAAGGTIVVRQSGQIVRTLPTTANEEVHIEGAYETVLSVNDGTARVVYSDCPGQDCVHMGTIRQAGQAIVCVPNQVSITIEGDGAAADAYTG